MRARSRTAGQISEKIVITHNPILPIMAKRFSVCTLSYVRGGKMVTPIPEAPDTGSTFLGKFPGVQREKITGEEWRRNFSLVGKKRLDFFKSKGYNNIRYAGVAEWQTHQLEVLAVSRLCGFKSHPPHQR